MGKYEFPIYQTQNKTEQIKSIAAKTIIQRATSVAIAAQAHTHTHTLVPLSRWYV